MTDASQSPRPAGRPSDTGAGGDREARLAAALRANLARRKAQRRARDGGAEPADPGVVTPAASSDRD